MSLNFPVKLMVAEKEWKNAIFMSKNKKAVARLKQAKASTRKAL